jgi:hypothetical protein
MKLKYYIYIYDLYILLIHDKELKKEIGYIIFPKIWKKVSLKRAVYGAVYYYKINFYFWLKIKNFEN